jgi:hypothetical protein
MDFAAYVAKVGSRRPCQKGQAMRPRHLVATIAVASACIALSTGAAAEAIFGTLTGPAGPNSPLVLTCDKATARVVATGAGSYRLTVAGRGRCRLQVGNMPLPGELVFVYPEATRYDYEVTTAAHGVTHIERR